MPCKETHTKHQPTDEEWQCPQCGAIYEDGGGWIIWDPVNPECGLLHNEDYLVCDQCNFETTGRGFAMGLARKANLVDCPFCQGKAKVAKSKLKKLEPEEPDTGSLRKKSPIQLGDAVIYRSGPHLCLGEVKSTKGRRKGHIDVVTGVNYNSQKANEEGTRTCALEWIEPLQATKLEKDETRVVKKILTRIRKRLGFTAEPWFKKE